MVSSDTITSPKGRLSYPSLLARNTTGEFPSGLFETILLIPKTTDISKLTACAESVLAKAFGDKFKSLDDLEHPPIRDGDEKGGEYAGHWYIKAKGDRKPMVVGTNPKILIEDPDQVYGGQWAKISMNCYSYNKKGKKGVSWGLCNAQILGGGDKFGGDGGDPESQFGSESAEGAEDKSDESLGDNF